jgi:hypothetical protein
MCDLDEILYMENNSRPDKKKFFENWNIDFDNIITKCKKEKNSNVYCLENENLKIIVNEIEKNWIEHAR